VYNFAIIGASGYIAPRHLKAILDTGNRLVAACDPHDSVGILDRYFPEARFFTEIERFDRYLEKLRLNDDPRKIDFVTVCSPNYLHDAHTRLGLRIDANVICEKPLVINPWNLDQMAKIELDRKKKIYTVLQLRVHPGLIALKERLAKSDTGKKHDVTLSYITPRGSWYQTSWKGVLDKSGGVATNIGIHLFDLMMWLFGGMTGYEVHYSDPSKMTGVVEFQNAHVRWFLSIDKKDIPVEYDASGNKAFRSILIDGNETEFSEGFTDLHTLVYKDIFEGRGYGVEDARQSIELVYHLRNSIPRAPSGDYHPMLKNIMSL